MIQGASTYLNNPLRIRLTQTPQTRLIRKRMRDTLARTLILNRRRTSRFARSFDGRGDHVAGGDGERGELVAVVGVPFVPGFVGGFAAFDEEVDAGLEDGWDEREELGDGGVKGRGEGRRTCSACIPVNADPC